MIAEKFQFMNQRFEFSWAARCRVWVWMHWDWIRAARTMGVSVDKFCALAPDQACKILAIYLGEAKEIERKAPAAAQTDAGPAQEGLL